MTSSDSGAEGFVQRIEEHQGILHRIAALYARDAEDRRDLFQEILLALWRSRGTFEERSRFTTWAFRVALNTALGFRRRAGRRPEAGADPALLEGSADPAQARAGEQADAVEELERVLRELPELDRALMLLRLEERGYEEIAEITGLSRANVSVRLVRIKEHLRRRLASAERSTRSLS